MATLIDEKQAPRVEAEHLERSGSDNELHKVSTLGVDVENHDAFKGDNSDGRVDWTWKQIAATICLTALYVGEQFQRDTRIYIDHG